MRHCMITLHTRDRETGEYTSTNCAHGVTLDGGLTIVIGPGCLPGLADSAPAAVEITIDQPPMALSVASITVSIDEVSGNQIVTVTPQMSSAEVV